ncbi:unnamed protein product, partial [Effrenium voratum]
VQALIEHGYRDVLGHAGQDYWSVQQANGVQPPDAPDCIAAIIFGDEAEFTSKNQYMCLHWQSDNADMDVQADSRMSRFPICMVDSSLYRMDIYGVNQTLQHALAAVVASFNELRAARPLAVQVCGVKGDWKYLKQSLCLSRFYNSNRICMLCEATKDLSCPYTDIAQTALWWSTILQSEPWQTQSPPSLLQIQGLQLLQNTQLDLMHLVHLGLGRDVVGSTLCILLRRRDGPFPGSDLQKRISSAGAQLRDACGAAFPRQFVLKKDFIGMRSTSEYVECHCKAAQMTAMLGWLLTVLAACSDQVASPQLKACLWCLNAFLELLFRERRHSHTLTQNVAEHAHALGMAFVQLYLELHHMYRGWYTYMLFNPRPKLHLCVHVLDDLRATRRNPARWVNFMDEDALKKLGQVARRCHARTVCTAALQRMLVGLLPKMDEALALLRRTAL